MHRRQILQAFAMGATLKVTGGLADIIGEPGKLVPAPPRHPQRRPRPRLGSRIWDPAMIGRQYRLASRWVRKRML